MEKNYCPSCGGIVENKDQFCPGCGAVISAIQEEKKSNSNRRTSSLVVLALAAIIVVVIYVVAYQVQKEDTPEFKHPEIPGMTGLTPNFDDIIAKLPQNYERLVELGNDYMDKKMFSLAVECYSRAAAIDSSDPNVMTDLGTCYFSCNEIEKAITIFKTVISEHPEHKIAYFNLGITYLNKNELEKTKEYWQQIIEFFPEDPLADTVKIFLERIKQQ